MHTCAYPSIPVSTPPAQCAASLCQDFERHEWVSIRSGSSRRLPQAAQVAQAALAAQGGGEEDIRQQQQSAEEDEEDNAEGPLASLEPPPHSKYELPSRAGSAAAGSMPFSHIHAAAASSTASIGCWQDVDSDSDMDSD